MSEESKMRTVFCHNINRLFAESDKQKKDLAAFVGVSDNTVTSWVKGRKVPRMDKIDMICAFFHVERKDIIVSPSQRTEHSVVFTAEEKGIIKKFRSLDARGQANVLALLNREVEFSKNDYDQQKD